MLPVISLWTIVLVRQVLILLTDGKSTSPTQTAEQARLLKETGVYVIAVGIGNSLNQNELHSIASDATGVVSVSAFSDLPTHLQSIKTLYCSREERSCFCLELILGLTGMWRR